MLELVKLRLLVNIRMKQARVFRSRHKNNGLEHQVTTGKKSTTREAEEDREWNVYMDWL